MRIEELSQECIPSKKLYWNNQVRIARILYEGRGQGGKLEPILPFLASEGGSWKGLGSVTKLIIIAFSRGNKDQLCSAVRQIILMSEACAWIPPPKLEEQRFSLCCSAAWRLLLPAAQLCSAHDGCSFEASGCACSVRILNSSLGMLVPPNW